MRLQGRDNDGDDAKFSFWNLRIEEEKELWGGTGLGLERGLRARMRIERLLARALRLRIFRNRAGYNLDLRVRLWNPFRGSRLVSPYRAAEKKKKKKNISHTRKCSKQTISSVIYVPDARCKVQSPLVESCTNNDEKKKKKSSSLTTRASLKSKQARRKNISASAKLFNSSRERMAGPTVVVAALHKRKTRREINPGRAPIAKK